MEIEAKIALTPALRQRLKEQLGEPVRSVRQRDVYLQTAGRPVALRVREDGERAWVTLKSGFEHVNGVRMREEFEPAISPQDLETWLTIFTRLGYPAGEVVAKTREEYDFMGVHVLLDTIDDLGDFVEVEAVADDADAALVRLEAAMQALGLADEPRLLDSYRKLLASQRS